MLVKIDENIPAEVATRLRTLGHDVDSVQREGLAGSSDDAVFAAAQKAGRFLITQDLDFSDMRGSSPPARIAASCWSGCGNREDKH